MISWLNFGIALFKTVNAILVYAARKEAVDEGRRQVIMEQLLILADKLKLKEKIRAEIDKMSDAEVDADLLRIGDARDVRPRSGG